VVCSKIWDVAVGTGRIACGREGGLTISTEWVVCSKMWDVAVCRERVVRSKQGSSQYRVGCVQHAVGRISHYEVGGVQQDVGRCGR